MNNDDNALVRRVPMTVSTPLELFVWLTRSQRNRSAYIVRAIEAQKARDEAAARGEEREHR